VDRQDSESQSCSILLQTSQTDGDKSICITERQDAVPRERNLGTCEFFSSNLKHSLFHSGYQRRLAEKNRLREELSVKRRVAQAERFKMYREEVGEQKHDDEEEEENENEEDELGDDESEGSDENTSDNEELEHSHRNDDCDLKKDDSFLHIDSQPVLGGFTTNSAGSPVSSLHLPTLPNPSLSNREEVGEQENDNEEENDEIELDDESERSNEIFADDGHSEHSDIDDCNLSKKDDSFSHMLDSQPVLGGFTTIGAGSPSLHPPTSLSQLQAAG
jgi:hypothetical protein